MQGVVPPSIQTSPGQPPRLTSPYGVSSRAGESVTTTEGDFEVTSTPYVRLPASEFTRHSYEAAKSLGPGTITSEAIERRRSEQLAAEIEREGGIRVRQDFRAEAARQGYQNVKDFYNKPVLGSLSAAQVIESQQRARARGTPKIERTPLRYEVGLGGKDSTFAVFERDSGKRIPLHYRVDLEDRLSGGPYQYYRDVGKSEKQVFEGTMPFMDLPEKDDPLAGFVNVFRNIPEFGKTAGAYVTGSKYEPKYEPEVEASIFSGLFGVGKRFVERKPAELQLTLAAKEFGEIGQFIQKRPFYAAGSIAASAALWLFPYGKVASAARASIPGLRAASKAPRARFDYDPLRGSFADRPSVRFGPYNPTRWENPEALAELAKYRAVVDLPKSVKIAAPASATRFTAFESARTRQEPVSVVETRGGSLVLRQEPIARSKVESIGVESAKQTVQKVMNEASQSRGAGRSARPSVSYERSIAGVSLGLGGATGAERRRRVIPTEYESYVLAYPQTTKNFLGSTLKNLGISRTDTGMRSFLQNLTGTRSRAATSSRSILSEITGLRGAEMQGFRLGQLSLTRTAQVQTPKVASELRSLLRTTGISVPRPRTPTLRIPKAVLFPGFTQSRKRKAKGSRRTRASFRTYAASDYVAAIAGKELGKQFKKIAGSY